jgi:3-hydroxybutyryl-CoA dehydrogenase
MRYICKSCNKEWDFQIDKCIFCRKDISIIEESEYEIQDITQVFLPSIDHPIAPYYVMLLKNSNGAFLFRKTFERHNIGAIIHLAEEQATSYKLGIIGTGVTGKGIAEVALRTGNQVILKSRSNTSIEKAKKIISKNLSKSMAPKEIQRCLNNLVITTEFESLSDADFVIESVTEDLGIKKKIFNQLDHICRSDSILASNTSSLSITDIAQGTTNPERIIGLHFFNPIPKMRLVEVIKGDQSSEEAIQKGVKLAAKMNKDPIIIDDSPGFIVNRLLFIMINESALMLDEDIASVEDIDKAMKLGANHPMGPLELADFIGLDLCMEIIENLHLSFQYKFKISKTLKDLVENGHYGRKSGMGFYEYA